MNASSSECTRTRQVPGEQRGLQTCIDSEFNYAKTFVCMRICAYGRDGAIFVQEEAARPAGQCNIHDKYFNFAFPHHFMEIQMAAAANFPFGFPIVLSAFWAFEHLSRRRACWAWTAQPYSMSSENAKILLVYSFIVYTELARTAQLTVLFTLDAASMNTKARGPQRSIDNIPRQLHCGLSPQYCT